MKRVLKWTGLLLLTPIALVLLVAVLLYVPPIQNWAVKKVAQTASEQTGFSISVGHVSLKFPLDLSIDNVLVVRPEGDTIASMHNAVVDVRLWPLLQSEVVVDRLGVDGVSMNTFDLVPNLQLSGTLGQFSVSAPGIKLNEGIALLSDALLSDADVSIALSDTAATDTTASAPVAWLVKLDHLNILRTRVRLSLPGDSMHVAAYMGQATATDAHINLADGHYAVGAVDWRDGSVSYDLTTQPLLAEGLDANHISLTGIGIGIDSIDFVQAPLSLSLCLRDMALTERSGLQLTDLHGRVQLDEQAVHTSGLTLATPYSTLFAQADVDLNVVDSLNPGQMDLLLDASIDKRDISLLAPPDTKRLLAQLPDWPLTLKTRLRGNMEQAEVETLDIELPTVAHVEANGTLANLTNPNSLLAGLDLTIQTYDLSLVSRMASLPPTVRLPRGMALQGTVDANGPRYAANLSLRQGGGHVSMKGFFDQQHNNYKADLRVQALNLHAFLPQDSIGMLSANATVQGQGTDFFVPSSHLRASITLDQLQYGQLCFTNMQADALLANGHARAHIAADNELLAGCIDADALLDTDNLRATLGAELGQVDLLALGVSQNPLSVGLCGHIDVNSNLGNEHYLSGLIGDLYVTDSLQTYRPEDVGLSLTTNPDTTFLRLQTGNLIVKADASGGYEQLIAQFSALADSMASQLDQRIIDQPSLQQLLPTMHLYATSGRNNPLANMLRASANIDFKNLLVDITSSPARGINGQAYIHALNLDSVRIDTVNVQLKNTEHGLTYQAQVTNNKRNPKIVFNAMVDGQIYEHGARTGLRFYDQDGKLGVRLGATVAMEEDGLRLQLMPKRPTIGYNEFALNDDNYLFLGKGQKLQAMVDLRADDGTGIRVYSEDQDSTLLQDLTITLNRFDLDQLTSSIPFAPHIEGILNGDYHLMMNTDGQISVASDMQIKGMAYEGSYMGDLGTEMVYLQREDDTHAVEGIIMLADEEVASVRGSYQNKDEGHIDATMALTRMPLSLVNGFIPDQMMGFEGYAEGELTLQGSMSRPIADGELYLDSAFLVSNPYGVRLRFDNDPVRIQNSQLLLENFTMYAHNQNPLNIMGNIDFSNTERLTMDLRMRAQNFQLINSKQAAHSVVYGKAFVNIYATMKGPMDHLAMQGKLDVLSNTDLTYLLLDSPLSTDNQLDELVKFTDFSDSTQTNIFRPEPNGLTMAMNISVAEGAHIKCGLNPDQTNYVDLFGGGDLSMQYAANDLTLSGRYTLRSGEIKYSLPVIPLKTFTIQDGSYVEFTGDPANPTLNLTATERTKTSVYQENGQSRTVFFDCGVIITKTLADMGLEFTIAAPEDMNVSNELNSLTSEERGKLAVTMLTTGMYLNDGNTGGFSMNSALSSFLESEINNITAGALKTLDLSIGLDNNTDASGQTHTDYSFKFAKRFWNNRLRVQVGGKVSSGQEATQGQNQSFFDNVTMEYRLAQAGNQYVKLFYNQNAYDWLEGYTGEYGGGFIWKRKLDNLLDVFRFSSGAANSLPTLDYKDGEAPDTTKTATKQKQ